MEYESDYRTLMPANLLQNRKRRRKLPQDN